MIFKLRVVAVAICFSALAGCGGSGDSSSDGGNPSAPASSSPGSAAAPAKTGSTASGGVQLTVWHGYRGDEKSAFEKVVANFNAAMADKNVSFKTLSVPYDAYADKITAAIPRGKGPDVFIFAQDRLGGWVEQGNTVESIDFYVEDEVLDSFVPNMMPAMTLRGTIFGLPFNYKMVTMIYNKALISEPPKTSGELVTLAKGLTDKSTGKLGLAYSYGDFYYHSALMNAFGGGVFDENAMPIIDNPRNTAAAEQMLRWYREDGILPDDPSTALVSSLFNQGQAAIVFSGPWFLGEVSSNIDVGLAPLPTVDEAGGAPMQPWLTIEGIYVSKGSKDKRLSYEFARFLVSEDAAHIMAVEGGQLPTNKAVYDHPDVAGDPVLAAFRAQLETSKPMPNFAEMTLMWSPVTTAMNKIMKGVMTPAAAYAEAQAKVSEDIAVLRKSQ